MGVLRTPKARHISPAITTRGGSGNSPGCMTQPSHSFSQRFLQPDGNRSSSNLVISEKAGSSSQLFKSKCLYDKLRLPPMIKNNILENLGENHVLSLQTGSSAITPGQHH